MSKSAMSCCTRPLLAAILGLSLCFAQEAPPEKLAVYVSGASDAGVNKSLGGKLLAVMSQSGTYTEIGDPGSFQDELAKSGKGDISSIAQAAKRHGADYVCAVSITEVFGAHSISARLIKIAGSQVVKTASADRSLKSLEDLTVVSNELARQLLPPSAAAAIPQPVAAPTPAVATGSAAPYAFLASGSFDQATQPDAATAAATPPPVATAPATIDRVAAAKAAAKKQCAKTYNINELVSRLEYVFPRRLKDCARKADPSFVRQCTTDGIKDEIPFGFPATDKLVLILDNFTQSILVNVSSARNIVSKVSSIDISKPLNDIKNLAFSNTCIVNEPYNPTNAYTRSMADDSEESDSDGDKGKRNSSFGIRAGLNFSIASENEYTGFGSGSGLGIRLSIVRDIVITDWFYISPGLMYIQKKERYVDYEHYYDPETFDILELPVMMSFKIPWLRSLRVGETNIPGKLNIGSFVGVCLSSYCDLDFGLSISSGFDIGMFYIDAFYDHSFIREISDGYGFNLGINL